MSITQLRRSRTDRMVAGVAGGLAALLKVDPVIVRIGFLFLGLINGFGLILYVIMWLLIPSETSVTPTPREQVRENLSEMRDAAEGAVQRIRSFFTTQN